MENDARDGSALQAQHRQNATSVQRRCNVGIASVRPFAGMSQTLTPGNMSTPARSLKADALKEAVGGGVDRAVAGLAGYNRYGDAVTDFPRGGILP